MTRWTTKRKYVLLDANVVIESHKLRVWSNLKSSYKLVLPAAVSKREALFYFVGNQKRIIKLRAEIDRSEIVELEATVGDLASLYTVFEQFYLDILDPGEFEALALLQAGKAIETSFCTSDAPAIKALAMMHMSHLGISLETMLARIGLTKNLDQQFTEEFFKHNLKMGQLNLVTGWGLVQA